MSNERIDLTQFEDISKQMEIKWHEHPTYGARYLIKVSEPETPWVVGAVVPDFEPHDDYAKNKIEQETMAKLFAKTPELIAELKRCYEESDWLLVVEDHFTSDGSYNNNANFVYECAVNEKYGYRIEVIDGVDTVVHESEYNASE